MTADVSGRRWTNLGYALGGGLAIGDGLIIVDDPHPVITWSASQRIAVTLAWKGDLNRAGWRALVGSKPPFGCGWRRHHLGRRQIMRRMHAAYGRRTR